MHFESHRLTDQKIDELYEFDPVTGEMIIYTDDVTIKRNAFVTFMIDQVDINTPKADRIFIFVTLNGQDHISNKTEQQWLDNEIDRGLFSPANLTQQLAAKNGVANQKQLVLDQREWI